MKVLKLLQLQLFSRTKVYRNILPGVLKYFTDITNSLPPLYPSASSTIRSPSLSVQSPIIFMGLMRKKPQIYGVNKEKPQIVYNFLKKYLILYTELVYISGLNTHKRTHTPLSFFPFCIFTLYLLTAYYLYQNLAVYICCANIDKGRGLIEWLNRG